MNWRTRKSLNSRNYQNLLEPRVDVTIPGSDSNFRPIYSVGPAKRHKADYDPGETFLAFDIVEDAQRAAKIIQDFMDAPREDKLAFVTLIALPEWKD